MYKVFLDANILLDYLINDRKGHRAAHRIFTLTAEEKLKSFISPISMLNIFFMLRKQKSEQERKDMIESFLDILEIVELDFDIMQLGLYSGIADYEDGIQYMSAKKADTDYIITDDKQFKKYDLEIKRIGPDDFISMLKS